MKCIWDFTKAYIRFRLNFDTYIEKDIFSLNKVDDKVANHEWEKNNQDKSPEDKKWM